MKKLLPFLMLFLLLIGTKAYASEPEYVVKLKNQKKFFRATKAPVVQVVKESELQNYLNAGLVELYAPNVPVKLCSSESDWNLEHIRSAFPNKIGCDGSGVTVAVIDSGVQEIGVLSGRVLPGRSYTQVATENGYTVDIGENVIDTYGHGTFVSSIVAGTAENASIIPLKVFEGSTTTLICVIQAIYDACVVYEADVINMSLALDFSSVDPSVQADAIAFLDDFVSNAEASGSTVVAAVGNEGSEEILYPAGCEKAIGVGAVTKDNAACSFSQKNESVYVVAPGQDVIGVAISGFTDNDGTSFAAPHVSGLAAIAKSMEPDMTPAQFRTLLAQTAINLGNDDGYDTTFGHGLIDCEAVTRALIGNQEVYLSPIHQTATDTQTMVYNNTDSPITVWCLYAHYNNALSVLNGSVPIETTIGARDIFTFENDYDSGIVRYMVLKSKATLQPLTKDRIR